MLYEITKRDTYERTWIVRADDEASAVMAVKRHFSHAERIPGLIAGPGMGDMGDVVDVQWDSTESDIIDDGGQPGKAGQS